jgi:DnaJ-class molecular chaperone
MSTWLERKEERRREAAKYHGVKMEVCTACSGSGYYDHNGSPACGSCNGRGKRLGRPNVPCDARYVSA